MTIPEAVTSQGAVNGLGTDWQFRAPPLQSGGVRAEFGFHPAAQVCLYAFVALREIFLLSFTLAKSEGNFWWKPFTIASKNQAH